MKTPSRLANSPAADLGALTRVMLLVVRQAVLQQRPPSGQRRRLTSIIRVLTGLIKCLYGDKRTDGRTDGHTGGQMGLCA